MSSTTVAGFCVFYHVQHLITTCAPAATTTYVAVTETVTAEITTVTEMTMAIPTNMPVVIGDWVLNVPFTPTVIVPILAPINRHPPTHTLTVTITPTPTPTSTCSTFGYWADWLNWI